MASPAAILTILVEAQTGRATTQLRKFDAEVVNSGKSADRTSKAMGGKLTKAMKLVGIAAAAGAAYGLYKAVDAGATFERQMSSLGSISEATAGQMKGFEKQALKLGESTQYTANQVAEAQTELAKGGLTAKQILGGALPAALSLAAAGQLELAQAAETTVNTMKLFGLKGKDTAQIADMLATAANKTTADVSDFSEALKYGGVVSKLAGYSLNETVTVLEALAEAGIKGTMAGTTFKTAIIQLLKPSKEQAELQKQLGLELLTSNGHLKDAAELSKELRIATDGMTKAERTKTLATLGGQRGVIGLNALYEKTPKALEALERANAKQGTAAKVAAEKMDNLQGDWENFTGALETGGIKLYQVIKGPLRAVTQWLAGAAQTLDNFNYGAAFDEVKEFVTKTVGEIEDFATRYETALTIAGTALAAFAAAWLTFQLGLAITAAIDAAVAAVMGLAAAFGALDVVLLANPITLTAAAIVALAVAGYVAYTKIKGFREVVDQVYEALGPIVAKAKEVGEALLKFGDTSLGPITVKEALLGLISPIALIALHFEAVKGFVVGAFTAIVGAVKDGISWIVRASQNVTGFVKALYPVKIVVLAVKIAAGLAYVAISKIVEAVKFGIAVVRIFTPLYAAAAKIIGTVLVAAIHVAIPVIETFLKFIGNIGSVVGDVVGIVSNLLRGKWGNAWKDAKQLVVDVLHTIEDVIKGAWTIIKTIFEQGVGALKKIVKIAFHGIQGTFENLGDFIGSVFESGWEKAEGVFVSGANAIIEVIDLIIKAINLIPGIPNIHKIDPIGGSSKQNAGSGGLKHQSKAGYAEGGLASVVPGQQTGDRHVLSLNNKPIAMVESQEGIFVGNRKMMAAASAANAAVPRFQGGGAIPGFGIGGILESAGEIATAPVRVPAELAFDAAKGAVSAAKVLASLPSGSGIPEPFSGVGPWAVGKAKDYIKGLPGSIFGGGASGAPGFKDGVLTGKVSWFNGGATAGGSNTSLPGVALNLNPGSESGWDNSTTDKFMTDSIAGHPDYVLVSIKGHAAKLPITDKGPAGFTQRAIDVTEGGVKKLGFPLGAFPTDSIGTAKLLAEGGPVGLMRGGPAGLELHGPALFTREGPAQYDRAFELFGPWSKPGPYQTKLDPKQEKAFKAFVKANPQLGERYHPYTSKVDYDLRGWWLNERGKVAKDNGQTYLSDTYKTPYSVGFSKWSEYAKAGTPYDWIDEDVGEGVLANLKTGQIVLDHRHAPNSKGEYSRDQNDGSSSEKPRDAFGASPKGNALLSQALKKSGWVTPPDMSAPKSERDRFEALRKSGVLKLAKGGSAGSGESLIQTALNRAQELNGIPYPHPDQHFGLQQNPSFLDCSAAVSNVLWKTGLLDEEMTSGVLEGWGSSGTGKLMTVYANAGHAWMELMGHPWGTSVGDGGAGGLGFHSQPGSEYKAEFTKRHSQAVDEGGSGHLTKEQETEGTFKENVPAEWGGCKAGQSLSIGSSTPKSLDGINKELAKRRRELTRYRATAEKATKKNKPAIAHAIQKNATALEVRISELERARTAAKQEAAKKKITGGLSNQLGKITGSGKAIALGERAFNTQQEYAEHVVDLEPVEPEAPPMDLPPVPSLDGLDKAGREKAKEAWEKQTREAERAYNQRRVAEEKNFQQGYASYVDNQEGSAYARLLRLAGSWRNIILEGEQTAAGHWQKKGAPIGGLEGSWETKIIDAAQQIQQDEQLIEKAHKDDKAFQKQNAKKKFEMPEWLTNENAAAAKAKEQIPLLAFKERELRKVLGEGQAEFYPGGSRIKERPTPPMAGSGQLEEALSNVQGLHWPGQHGIIPITSIPPVPVLGEFGGVIWGVQEQIQELGLKASSALRAAGETGAFEWPEELEEGGGSEEASASETARNEWLEEELRKKSQREAIYARQSPIIDAYIAKDFAGMFAKGGSIPAGKWGIAGEAGPEPVFGPATVVSNANAAAAGPVSVEVHNYPDGSKVLVNDMEVVAAKVYDHKSRSGGRGAKTIGARNKGRIG